MAWCIPTRKPLVTSRIPILKPTGAIKQLVSRCRTWATPSAKSHTIRWLFPLTEQNMKSNCKHVFLWSSSDPTRTGFVPKGVSLPIDQWDLVPPKLLIQMMLQNREPTWTNPAAPAKIIYAYLTYWLTEVLFKAAKLASVSYSWPNTTYPWFVMCSDVRFSDVYIPPISKN